MRLVPAVARLDHVLLLLAPQPVLRREEGGELAGELAGEQGGAVLEVAVDGRLVQEKTEPGRAGECFRRRFEADFKAGNDGGHGKVARVRREGPRRYTGIGPDAPRLTVPSRQARPRLVH